MLEQNQKGNKETRRINKDCRDELLPIALRLCRSPVECWNAAVLPPAAAATQRKEAAPVVVRPTARGHDRRV
ncbi:hypothetical protein LXL04_003824 [Taraxacum kok-saghyz]